MSLCYFIDTIKQKRYSVYNHIYEIADEIPKRYGLRNKKYDRTVYKHEEFDVKILSLDVSANMLKAELQLENVTYVKNYIPLSFKRFLHDNLKLPLFSSLTSNSILHCFNVPVHKTITDITTILEPTSIKNVIVPEFFEKKIDLFHYIRMLDAADIIIAHSDYMAHQLSTLLFISEDKIRTIPRGTAKTFYELPENMDTANKEIEDFKLPDKFILFAGKITRYKNLERLLVAFNKVAPKDISLVIAGDFDTRYETYDTSFSYLTRLKKLSETFRAGRVKFIGYVKKEFMPLVLNRATALVEPSHINDFPDTIIEAQAAGIPVVASDIEEHRSVCHDSVLYFSSLSKDSLAEAIDGVTGDNKIRETLKERGKTCADKYSWDKTAPKYLKLYRSL